MDTDSILFNYLQHL